MTKGMNSDKFLHFSGVPVICRACGTQLKKHNYKKGADGSYLCKSCYNKIYRTQYRVN